MERPQDDNAKIKSFFTNVFWGVKNKEVFVDLMRLIAKQTQNYHFSDNMFTFQRNNSMLSDPHFVSAWRNNIQSESDNGIIWRRYILCMAAYHCAYLSGDFVECGAYEGVGAKTVIDYIGREFKKTFWLYDIFEHLPHMANHRMPKHGEQLFEAVRDRFSGYPNVRIVRGELPGSLANNSPDQIAYLHIDLNQAAAEIGTLDVLFERVVPGGIIILDDYEMSFYREQKLAEDRWFGSRGYKVMPLPTSQGLVIKR